MDSNKWDEIFINNQQYKPLNEIFLNGLLKKIKEEINPLAKKIVDLGCGTSGAVFQFSKRGFSEVGIDFSRIAIEKLQEKINKNNLQNIKLISTDLNNLDINLEADIFLCKFVYSFIKNKNDFLKKILESMKNNSVFILITPVTYENVTYTENDKPGIAVDFRNTFKKLKSIFTDVQIYHHDYVGIREDYITFLIKK